jgi:predicted O-methyltransferase YrrM
MNSFEQLKTSPLVEQIYQHSIAAGFGMASEPQTGNLLRTLAASKPQGRFLEIGTGTGYGTAWILEGMDSASSLESVDNDPQFQAIARQYLGADPRVSFHLQDALQFLATRPVAGYDFIFADALPGKFERFDLTLKLLKPGGLLVLDDLLPQPNWPAGHAPKVEQLFEQLEQLTGYQVSKLHWSSGIVLLTRQGLT